MSYYDATRVRITRPRSSPELKLKFPSDLSVGETSRGIHGLSKTTERNETEDHGVLRTPVPRKVLRRRADPWRALGKAERST